MIAAIRGRANLLQQPSWRVYHGRFHAHNPAASAGGKEAGLLNRNDGACAGDMVARGKGMTRAELRWRDIESLPGTPGTDNEEGNGSRP